MQVRLIVHRQVFGRPRISDCLQFSTASQSQWLPWLRIFAALLMAFALLAASGRGCKTETNRADVSAR